MRNKKYKAKNIKVSEDTWQKFKDKRKRSNLSVNLYLKKLLDKDI